MSNWNTGKVTAEGYLVFVVDSYKWSNEIHIRSIRIKHFRSSKPKLSPGEIPLKVKFHFNKEQLVESIPVIEAEVTNFSVTPAGPAEVEIINDATAISGGSNAWPDSDE